MPLPLSANTNNFNENPKNTECLMDLRVGMALRGFSIQEYHDSAEKTENKFKSFHELVQELRLRV